MLQVVKRPHAAPLERPFERVVRPPPSLKPMAKVELGVGAVLSPLNEPVVERRVLNRVV